MDLIELLNKAEQLQLKLKDTELSESEIENASKELEELMKIPEDQRNDDVKARIKQLNEETKEFFKYYEEEVKRLDVKKKEYSEEKREIISLLAKEIKKKYLISTLDIPNLYWNGSLIIQTRSRCLPYLLRCTPTLCQIKLFMKKQNFLH